MSPDDTLKLVNYPSCRQRRPHKKSRSGCTNCRFRRVKCDESKPKCNRCRSYMVPCTYGGTIEDLRSLGEDVMTGVVVHDARDSLVAHSASHYSSSPTCNALALLSADPKHDVVLRFQNRTVFSLGDARTAYLYAETVPKLVLQHDFLLHSVFATVLLHDRALARTIKPLPIEAYHLSNAALLFNQRLSGTITEDDRDALWTTAVLLCAVSVYNLESLDSDRAWPLRPNCQTDLEWLNLQNGLQVVWSLVDPKRGNGMFARVKKSSEKVNCVYPDKPLPGIDGVPHMLADLCVLNDMSTACNNPYHTAVKYISQLLLIPGTPENILTFMAFAGSTTQEFKTLLRNKDPRALLLMALWYSKLFYSTWWMIPRATVECRAICRYLSNTFETSVAFWELLAFVNALCDRLDVSAVIDLDSLVWSEYHSTFTGCPLVEIG